MTTGLGRKISFAVAALAVLALPSNPAAELVAALSNHLVAITTGFSGTSVLLFGKTDGKGDVIVAVRGPEVNQIVRRKGRSFGIWINEAEVAFRSAPSFYALAASAPIETILSEGAAARHQLGLQHLRLEASSASPAAVGVDASVFREALIRNKQRDGLYSVEPEPVTFLGSELFRSDMYIPANAPVGTYAVGVFLVRDGDVVSAETTPLVVSKVGFEARLFDFAHRYAPAYGALAIVVAAVAGWLANLVFRKD